MLNTRFILCLAFAAMLSGIAAAGPSSQSAAPPVSAVATDSGEALAPAALVSPGLVQATLCGEGLSPGVGPRLRKAWLASPLGDSPACPEVGVAAGRGSGAIVTLPDGPSSASLVTAGLLCIGAFGGLRSLRKAHFGSLPEWYSTSGPRQIGHATPIDFDFPVLDIRPFETVEPLANLCFALPLDVDISPQRERLTLVSPRGPPVV